MHETSMQFSFEVFIGIKRLRKPLLQLVLQQKILSSYFDCLVILLHVETLVLVSEFTPKRSKTSSQIRRHHLDNHFDTNEHNPRETF